MPLTSVSKEIATSVTLETPKVAMSLAPLGTVSGVQFVAVFQSLVAGLRSQVALPAKAEIGIETNRTAPRRKAFMNPIGAEISPYFKAIEREVFPPETSPIVE